MNPTVSLVIEVATVIGFAAVDGVATVVGVVATDGACRPMGILWWLRLQVSPYHCESNEETRLMDCW